MYSLLAFTAFYVAHSQEFETVCAWNRNAVPVPESNIAGTYNFINGNYIRNYEHGDTHKGQPYFKYSGETCYSAELWLIRYQHPNTLPIPSYNWVISSVFGNIQPNSSYAYCSAPSANQVTPFAPCDGYWKIGDPFSANPPQDEDHQLDLLFKVMRGGCPQFDCGEILYQSQYPDRWTNFESGKNVNGVYQNIFTYHDTNRYRVSSTRSQSGDWYLFWNPKTWAWAIDEYIDEYEECKKYLPHTTGFMSVAPLVSGEFQSTFTYLPFASDEFVGRFLDCQGTPVDTPAPVTFMTWMPTASPQNSYDCSYYNSGWSLHPATQAMLEAACGTPSPVVVSVFTGAPVTSPTVVEPPSDSPTDPPVAGPPTYPTSQPSDVTPGPTPGPTVVAGSPSRNPTMKPSKNPTVYRPGSPSRSPSKAPTDVGSRLDCNIYVLCVGVVVYRVLF